MRKHLETSPLSHVSRRIRRRLIRRPETLICPAYASLANSLADSRAALVHLETARCDAFDLAMATVDGADAGQSDVIAGTLFWLERFLRSAHLCAWGEAKLGEIVVCEYLVLGAVPRRQDELLIAISAVVSLTYEILDAQARLFRGRADAERLASHAERKQLRISGVRT